MGEGVVQATLLPDAPGPAGLQVRADFVSPAEERALLDGLQALALKPFEFHGWTGKRLTTSFGWRYDFGDSSLSRTAPIPEFLLALRPRVAEFAAVSEAALEHVLVVRYDPGAGIGWHRDRPVFDRVVGISLNSACTLRFRRRAGWRFERFNLDAQPRSAYLLAGEARHQWEHGIAAVEALRFSLTWRTLA